MKTKHILFSLVLFFPLLSATADSLYSADVVPENYPKTAVAENETSNKTITEQQAFAIVSATVASTHYDKRQPASGIAMFGDTIVIKVTDVELIKARRSMLNPIILYINRVPFPDINGHLVGNKANEIKFILQRNFEDNEKWDKVLRTGFLYKSLYVGVGLANGEMVTPVSFPVRFTLRTPAEALPFIALCIALGCFTIFIVWKRKLLQEKIHGYYIYSLSNVHLFFWTQIILLSYILIWFVCDDMNSIDSSSLVLLGISAGTASVSTILNANNKNIKSVKAKPSEGFLKDILADNHEFSMHRYQIFIFNVVIGAFFIYKTIDELKMPVLNETVLALLGISSATYTAIKAIDSKNLLKITPPPSNTPPAAKSDTSEQEHPE